MMLWSRYEILKDQHAKSGLGFKKDELMHAKALALRTTNLET